MSRIGECLETVVTGSNLNRLMNGGGTEKKIGWTYDSHVLV